MGKAHEDTGEVREAPRLHPRRPWVVVTRGDEVTYEAPLAVGASTVGRAKYVEIPPYDPHLHRKHCRIYRDADDGIMVEDLASTGGTYLDGRRVDQGALREGSRLVVGSSSLRIELR